MRPILHPPSRLAWMPAALVICQLAGGLEVPPKIAEREVIVRDHVEIKFHPDAWLIVLPRDPTVQLVKNEPAGPGIWHAWGPPGLYQVYELRRDTGQQTAAQFEIVAGIDPGPGPVPPTPSDLPKGVMLLYETTSGGEASERVNIAVRRELDQHYAGRWKLLDPDMRPSDLQYAGDEVRQLFERAKQDAAGSYPWVLISDERGVQSMPMPPTADAMLQLLPRSMYLGEPRKAYCKDGTCFDQYGNLWTAE